MFVQSLVFIVLCTVIYANDDQSFNQFRGHVVKKDGNYHVVSSVASAYQEPDRNLENIIVAGLWDQNYNVTGWSVLEIQTTNNQTNAEQAYSAGLLEGNFTRDLINMQKQNNIDDICANQMKFCTYLKQFLSIQLNWMYVQIRSYPNNEYWHQVSLTLIQLNGLIDGYHGVKGQPRIEIDDPLGFFLFQIVESTGDLGQRFNVSGVAQHDSCSALIKLLPDNSDIFMSHADWSHYKTMLKVIKRYNMALKRTTAPDSAMIPGADTIFSSYPGTLHSVDDFYMTRPATLTVIETTIVNYNTDLLHNISPISVPEWIRVVVANRLASSGQEWIDKFFLYNDGTYNNQWMIADYKQFTPGQPPNAGFLMVAEQLVTYHESQDMTEILKKNGYWASYNNVYFPSFRNLSGEEAMAQREGPALYSWNSSARALIFKREEVNVTDLQSMIHMMRYNEFETDKYSECLWTPGYSSELTIAARCELNPITGNYSNPLLGHRPHGATDAKITNSGMVKDFTLVAIAGPTTDNGRAPFIWSESDFDKQYSHVGHPDVWNFTSFSPTWKLS